MSKPTDAVPDVNVLVGGRDDFCWPVYILWISKSVAAFSLGFYALDAPATTEVLD